MFNSMSNYICLSTLVIALIISIFSNNWLGANSIKNSFLLFIPLMINTKI